MNRSPTQHTVNTPYLVGPVHFYTVEYGGGLLLFDTGPPTREAKEYLRQHVNLTRLRYVFITHCHIDHYGLAYWLERETGATIFVPYRDALKMRKHDIRMQQMYELLFRVGFEDEYLQALRAVFDSGVLFPPFPREYRIAEESIPAELGIEVVNCPGHSQSDVVYAFDEYAVTGDTLLRGIFQSPLLDVDLETGKRFNNYAAYCESIHKLSALNGRTVLPGHRRFVESAQEIINFYINKLLQRVQQLLPYAAEGNIPVIIRALFQDSMQDVFHIYLKASEILFMQDFLADPKRLEISLRQIGLFDTVADAYQTVTGR